MVHKLIIMVAGIDSGHNGKYGWAYFDCEKISFSMEKPIWQGNGGVRKGDWVVLLNPIRHGKNFVLSAREAREINDDEFQILRSLKKSWIAFNERGEELRLGPDIN